LERWMCIEGWSCGSAPFQDCASFAKAGDVGIDWCAGSSDDRQSVRGNVFEAECFEQCRMELATGKNSVVIG
jgi:hypothetical protein